MPRQTGCQDDRRDERGLEATERWVLVQATSVNLWSGTARQVAVNARVAEGHPVGGTPLSAEVDALPAHARFLVGHYCLNDDLHSFVPEHGFTKMDLESRGGTESARTEFTVHAPCANVDERRCTHEPLHVHAPPAASATDIAASHPTAPARRCETAHAHGDRGSIADDAVLIRPAR